MSRTGGDRLLVPNHEMAADLNRCRIHGAESCIAIQGQKLWTRFAIEPQKISADAPCFSCSPVQHGAGKPTTGEAPRDRQTVNVERFTRRGAWPEDRIFVVQIHTGTKFGTDPARDQFAGARDTRQFLT